MWDCRLACYSKAVHQEEEIPFMGYRQLRAEVANCSLSLDTRRLWRDCPAGCSVTSKPAIKQSHQRDQWGCQHLGLREKQCEPGVQPVSYKQTLPVFTDLLTGWALVRFSGDLGIGEESSKRNLRGVNGDWDCTWISLKEKDQVLI